MTKNIEQTVEERFNELCKLTRHNSQPNINWLWHIAKDIQSICLNIKFFGYDLARQIAEALPKHEGTRPYHIGLRSKPSTQSDLESDWAAYWASELKVPIVFARKLW